jgi:hypothetical protein
MKTLHLSLIMVLCCMLLGISTAFAESVSGEVLFMKSNSVGHIYVEYDSFNPHNQVVNVDQDIYTGNLGNGVVVTTPDLTITANPSSINLNASTQVTYTIAAKNNLTGIYSISRDMVSGCGAIPLVIGLNESEVDPRILWQFFTAVYTCPAVNLNGPAMGPVHYDGIVSKIVSVDTDNPILPEGSNPPVLITQVELDSPFVFLPDNQICYDKPGFSNNYTCLTNLVPGHKVQCAYFLGSSTCEPIHQHTSGTNKSCLGSLGASNAPQWFDVYNTQNKTIQLQYFDVRVPSHGGGSYNEDGPYYTIPSIGPHEKCTYGFFPVDEAISLDPTNKTIAISYDYEGKHYTTSTPSFTDLYNDTRTWQFDGNKWIFAEQNTVTVPEFPFAIPVLLTSIILLVVFYRMKFRLF